MKNALLAIALITAGSPALAEGSAVSTPAAAPAAKPAFTTADTDIGTLLDNPATKAILVKNLPGLADNPQIDMARAMTLKQIQNFAPDMITDAALAKIDGELAAIPAK